MLLMLFCCLCFSSAYADYHPIECDQSCQDDIRAHVEYWDDYVSIIGGRVTCAEDGEPAPDFKVRISRYIFPFIEQEVFTGERGIYWAVVAPGVFKVQAGDVTKIRFAFGHLLTLPFLACFEVDCYPPTTTTTVCPTCPPTTTVKPTTSVPVTTTVCPVTTTVKPTTSIPNTTTIFEPTTSIPSTSTIMGTSTTTEPPVTTTIPEPTTTTTICKEDNRRCELQCKDECDLKPFAFTLVKFFPRFLERMSLQGRENNECFRECMKECTPLDKDSECADN